MTIESAVIALDKQQLTELAADLLLLAKGQVIDDGQDFAVLTLSEQTALVICEESKFDDICNALEADEVD